MVLISYGSLYPFRFHACSISAGSFTNAPTSSNRGDVVSNILLYAPLGFFASRAIAGRSRSIAWATLSGFALSALLETVQQCADTRVPSLADIIANTIGALLGAVFALAWRPSYTVLLAACWIGSRMVPFLPSPHLEKYWTALKAAAAIPAPLDVFRYFALWLAAAVLLEGRLFRALAVVVVARIVAVDVTLGSAEVIGALAAVFVVRFTAARSRVLIAAYVLAIFIAISALEPFRFLSAPRGFQWIPFIGFMGAPRESASRVFLEKSFMYGALVAVPVRAGMRFGLAVPVAAVMVFALRLTQVYLPGRSAEITDTLMVLMLAATMQLMKKD